jgi:hypothetical protein
MLPDVNKEEEESIVIVRLLSIDYLFESALVSRAAQFCITFSFFQKKAGRDGFTETLNMTKKKRRYQKRSLDARALSHARQTFFASKRKKSRGRLVCARLFLFLSLSLCVFFLPLARREILSLSLLSGKQL